MSRIGVFAPLRERNFRRYAAARIVNMSGTTMAGVALAFAVLDEDDSPSRSARCSRPTASRWWCSCSSGVWSRTVSAGPG